MNEKTFNVFESIRVFCKKHYNVEADLFDIMQFPENIDFMKIQGKLMPAMDELTEFIDYDLGAKVKKTKVDKDGLVTMEVVVFV